MATTPAVGTWKRNLPGHQPQRSQSKNVGQTIRPVHKGEPKQQQGHQRITGRRREEPLNNSEREKTGQREQCEMQDHG